MDMPVTITAKNLLYRFRTLPAVKARKVRAALYAAGGLILGYLVLHPFSMVVFSSTKTLSISPLEAFLMSFNGEMWAMWLWYGALGTLWGLGIAILVNRVRIVEGLIPICAWCGKIKDENNCSENGFVWKRLDKYLAEKGVEETHGLCPDCFDKLKAKLRRRQNKGMH